MIKDNTLHLIPYCLLFILFFLTLGSMWNDSGTFDEVAHIPAGYSYLTRLDYRLNPEHPPLVKVLSAISLWLFSHPLFPDNNPAWTEGINEQWVVGNTFLYGMGNDADSILFWSRIPTLLLAVLTAGVLFLWARKRFNQKIAALALFFFIFSPTILTHSKYVTTDIGATLGMILGITAFVAFLENRSWKNTILLGLAFGTAQLIKFSLVMLIPIYFILLTTWIFTRPYLHIHERIYLGARLFAKTIIAGLIGLLLIWTVYAIFTAHYPPERQYRDTETILSTSGFRPGVNFNLFLTKYELTRPLGEYVLGVLMANQRRAGGNTTYFMGEVSSEGWASFFPLIYLFKEPLGLHILTIIALWFGAKKIARSLKENREGIRTRITMWIEMHFTEFAALITILFYWGISVASPLNIGIRHIIPTFPFIFILIAKEITEWLRWHDSADPSTWGGWLQNIYQLYIKAIPKFLIVALILIWMILSSISIFPHFMSYYNELAPLAARALSMATTDGSVPLTGLAGGGPLYGYTIAVDSNYDWGQDLKRLAAFVKEQKIEKINLDYFGGAVPRYYLGDKFEPWWSARGPASGWFAVSATLRQGAFGKIGPGFSRKPEDSYEWLKKHKPIDRIGYSIFIYQLP